jgi:thiamine-monophosphate kinase
VAGAHRPGEFALIERYFRPLADNADAFGLTDDAAAYRQRPGDDLVLTTDTVAAGIHFFADDPAEAIARKALRVNLSDLASKGATPYGYLLALALPENWTERWLSRFAAALAADQKTYGVTLIGGDTTKAADGLSITITAIGRVPKGEMVLRAGAEPGDAIFVSGTIGDAALGLRIRQGRLKLARGGKALVNRYLNPQPRVSLAPAVLRHASAAMDVSDGLVGDLGHICDVSGVGAEIQAAAVPLSTQVAAALRAEPKLLGAVLNGGDDYEILATVPERLADAYVAEAANAGVAVTRIGMILLEKGPPVVRDAKGNAIRIIGSHSHF